jgi:hypothetical protein
MLARLTTAMLMLYFTLAVGFHIKAGAKSVFGGMAAGLMVVFAAMTAQRRRPPTSHWWMQARDLTRSTRLDESSRGGSLDSPGLRSKPNGKQRNASN